MTAEPIRQPDDEVPEEEPRREEERPPEDQRPPEAERPPEDQAAPSADESLTATATEPVTAPGESLTPEAAESAESWLAAELAKLDKELTDLRARAASGGVKGGQ